MEERWSDSMTTEDKIEREAKQNLRQGVPDLMDLCEELAIVETEDGRSHIVAVMGKMEQLIREGYEPVPIPELGKPTRMENGDLRFLAKSNAMRERAEAALDRGAVEDWFFFNGLEDEKVIGRVMSVEPVYALTYFTVRATEEYTTRSRRGDLTGETLWR